MKNLKAWLCNDPNLPDSQIIELGELVRSGKSFSDYKLIKWSHSYDPSEQTQYNLIEFVQSGAALMCASTPWGYLQIYPNKTLQDMTLHNFLKNFMGILFTPNVLWLSDEVDLSHNRAKHSQFDLAMQKITSNPQKIGKYLGTIHCGFEPLNREGILPENKILELKEIVTNECQSCGLNFVPRSGRPVRNQDEKNVTKLLGQCLNYSNGL